MLGASTFWSPRGSVQACKGIALWEKEMFGSYFLQENVKQQPKKLRMRGIRVISGFEWPL